MKPGAGTHQGITYPCITVTRGMSGYFAVMYHLARESYGTFPEPWDTGFGRYKTQAEAISEAQGWAEAEGIPYQAPKPDETVPDPRPWTEQVKEIMPDATIVRVGPDGKITVEE